jgi:hypothetical protein
MAFMARVRHSSCTLGCNTNSKIKSQLLNIMVPPSKETVVERLKVSCGAPISERDRDGTNARIISTTSKAKRQLP